MKAGDRVSVYADVNGKCLRGLVKPFNGEKLFVGNGIVQFSREDIYCSRDPLRLELPEYPEKTTDLSQVTDKLYH